MNSTDFRANVLILPMMLAMVCSELPAANSSDAEGVLTDVLFEKPASQGEYRIPGVLALEDGTVLAFCADRKGRGDFGHDTTTVLRRSTDGGKTWGPIREIAARPGADIHSGPVVYDRDTNRPFKFCRYWPAAKDAKKTTDSKTYSEMAELGWVGHVQISDDQGETWTASKPVRMDFRPTFTAPPPGTASMASSSPTAGC